MPFDIDLDDNVTFDEDEFIRQGNFNPYIDNTPKMIKLVIRTGLARNKKQANIFLLSMTVVLVIATIFLIRSSLRTTPEPVAYDSLTPVQKLQLPKIIRESYEN